MSLIDVDSSDLWNELQRRLERGDAEAALSPLVTVVKPVRVVTLLKQDTVVLGEDACPPGSIDLAPCSEPAAPAEASADLSSAGLSALLDQRLAAHDRERDATERARHDELLATLHQRAHAADRLDRDTHTSSPARDSDRPQERLLEGLESRLRALEGRATRTGPTTNDHLVDALHSMTSELRVVGGLLTRGHLLAGPRATATSSPVPTSSAEPREPSEAAVTQPPKKIAEARAASGLSTRGSILLGVSLAFVFFSCGVFARALVNPSPGAADVATADTVGAAGPAPVTPTTIARAGSVVPAATEPSSAKAPPRASPARPSDGFDDAPVPLDSDGDGLYDPGSPGLPAALLDRCPTAPGTRERQGCPERVDDDAPSPAARLQSLDGVIEGVNFDVDRASLRPESLEILNHAVAVLREHPTARIEISGHTDSAGEYEHNLELSRSRAETVRDYLVDRGIAAERLETVGHGPDRPIADNRTRAGRLRNRRIEFKPLE